MNDREQVKSTRKNEVSKFYFACRNGDIDQVTKLLPSVPYEQLKELESNGSNPLHAATFYGCERHQKNKYGLTAYEQLESLEGVKTLWI